MARRKSGEINIRSLMVTAGGSSFMMTLPIEMIRELGWETGEKLELQKQGDFIVVGKYTPAVEEVVEVVVKPISEDKPEKKKKGKKKKGKKKKK